MSARISYSLTDGKSGGAQKQHIGCMNGILHLFDRGHFLSGSRRPTAVARKRRISGQEGNCDAEEDTVSIKSTGEVPKSTAKERQRPSTDSSRSSASSTCYSSSFSSSVEDNNRLAKMEPLPVTVILMEQGVKDLPRLQQGNNSLPKSGAMTYVDSPRPVIPSKVRERNSAVSTPVRDLPSRQRPRSFVDSPRFSYDGRESRDAIKSNAMRLKEQPRHSLDSKCQSSVVAKLMGLEAAPDQQASSKPQMVQGRNNSVDALDPFSVSSRTDNEYKHELSADLVVRLKSNARQVLKKVALVPKESPLLSPSVSVYGKLEKRLEQVEFKRSGKDLRARKQILEAMQKFKQPEDDRKNIHRVVTETGNVGKSDFAAKFAVHSSMKPACSVNPRGTQTQRNSSNRKRSNSLPPSLSPRYARYMNRSSLSTHSTGEHRHIVESDCTGRNQGNSSARLLKSKKHELTDSPRRSNQTVRQPREPASPRIAPKSKVSSDLIISNAVSTKSDDDASLMSRDDDSEVSSYHVTQEEQTPKKVQLLQSEVNDNPPLKYGIIQTEQPSPVSVLDPSYLVDESLSPIMSEGFKDGESAWFCRQDRGLHASAEILPEKKHDHDHTYILQTPNDGSLMTIQLRPSGAVMANLFPTVEPDKMSNKLLMGQSHPKRGERIHRKLLFDVVDEIMVQKLVSDNNNRDQFSPFSLAAKKTAQEQLLQGLCSEIAQVRANYKCDVDDEDGDYIKAILRRDMEGKSQNWNGCFDDSSIVLDIERLIFKDLVTEVLTGEAVLRDGLTCNSRLMASV